MKRFVGMIALMLAVFMMSFAQTVSVQADCVAGDTTAPAKVTNLQPNAVAASSIIYSFTLPSDASTLQSVDLRYSTAPITARNWASATQATGEPAPGVSGATQVASLSGLSPSTTYYAALTVSDSCGKVSVVSNVASFTMLATPPIKDEVLTFSWTKNTDGVTTGYNIYYGSASGKYDYVAKVGDVNMSNLIIACSSGKEFFFAATAYSSTNEESDYTPEVPYTCP